MEEGLALGCEAIQVFTRNQRQWRPKPLRAAEARRFREAARAAGYAGRAMSHASYLINLCATVALTLRRSRWALVDEIRRCEALGIPYLCVHPGAHMGAGEEAGLALVAESLRHAIARTTRRVTVLLENTAGQGTSLGWRLEHLAALLRVPRTGVVLDTCHLFAAGYDLRTPRAYEKTMRAVEETVGLERVKAFHLNDSKAGLGSRVDRHEHIGRGGLRGTAFRRLVNDPRWATIFGVLETPKASGMDWKNLRLLRRMRTEPPAGAGRRRRRTADAEPLVRDRARPVRRRGPRGRAGREEAEHPRDLGR
ncbi:MAG: deoxyribonuclease IV [Planctomycetes bacterium]|nr:deoxyribonuclease IV [Planctomycetota bacterium]